jgi:hypothetical protein
MGVMPRVGNTSVRVRIPDLRVHLFPTVSLFSVAGHPENPLQIRWDWDPFDFRYAAIGDAHVVYFCCSAYDTPFCLRLLNCSSVTRLSSCVLAPISS